MMKTEKQPYQTIKRVQFYQKSPVGDVLDFNKIRSFGYPIMIILSERGQQGKTFNMLEMIRTDWLEHKHRAVWIYNTYAQFEIAKTKFLKNNIAYNHDKWKGVKVWKKGLYDENNEIFCYFAPLTTAEAFKTARDYSIKTVCYDEFNVSTQLIKNKQASLLETILFTIKSRYDVVDDARLFIFGNQKTLASNLLSSYGIVKLDKEIAIINEIILLFVPEPNMRKIDEQTKKSWIMQHSKITGNFDANVLNKNIYDNMNGVIGQLDSFDWLKKDILYIENCYYQQYSKDNFWYFCSIKKPDKYIKKYTLRKQYVESDVILNTDITWLIIRKLMKNIIMFDSYNTKRHILDNL